MFVLVSLKKCPVTVETLVLPSLQLSSSAHVQLWTDSQAFGLFPPSPVHQNKDLKSRVTHLEGSQRASQDSLVSKLNIRIQELEERLQEEER